MLRLSYHRFKNDVYNTKFIIIDIMMNPYCFALHMYECLQLS
jgi:hypothetical protein